MAAKSKRHPRRSPKKDAALESLLRRAARFQKEAKTQAMAHPGRKRAG